MTSFIGPVVKNAPMPARCSSEIVAVIPQAGGLPDLRNVSTNLFAILVPDTRNTYRFPGFRNVIKQGGNAAAPYYRQQSFVDVVPGYSIVNYLYSGVTPARPASEKVTGCSTLNYPATLEIEGYLKADNMALVRFYGAIRAEYEHMNTLIFAGELRESVRMLRKPFKSIQDATTKYLATVDRRGKSMRSWQYRRRRKGKPPTAAEYNQMISEAWLESSFGWRPLLSDVGSIAETIARLQESPRRSAVQGFGEQASNGIATSFLSSEGAYNLTRVNQIDKTVWKVKYRAGLHAAVSGPDGTAYRLRSLAGFQPENFVPTVWNLLPWSFLVDYFFNVGQVLSAHWTCTTDVSWAIKSELGRTTRDLTANIDHSRIRSNLGVNYISSGGSFAWKNKSGTIRATRTILNVANLPTPLIDTKSFSEWNPLKVANVIALLKARSKAVSSTLLTTSRG